jgi:hypothetical protein
MAFHFTVFPMEAISKMVALPGHFSMIQPRPEDRQNVQSNYKGAKLEVADVFLSSMSMTHDVILTITAQDALASGSNSALAAV